MKRSRFSEEAIIGIFKEHQAGLSAAELCRRHGISDATFYNWRSKYGGMNVSDAKKLKALEAENAKLKRLLAESVMDVSTLKEMLEKTSDARFEEKRRGLGDHRQRLLAAPGVFPGWCLERKTYRYASRRPADEAIRKRLRELASERRRFGTLIAGIGDLLISVLGLYCALESQVSE